MSGSAEYQGSIIPDNLSLQDAQKIISQEPPSSDQHEQNLEAQTPKFQNNLPTEKQRQRLKTKILEGYRLLILNLRPPSDHD